MTVVVTSPGGVVRQQVFRANRIGWVYDPTFDFVADETGRWTVDVFVEHDQPYSGTNHHGVDVAISSAKQLEAGEELDLTDDIQANYEFFEDGPGYWDGWEDHAK